MSALLPAGLLPAKVLSVSVSSAVLAGSLAGFAFTTSDETTPAPPPRAVAETMRAPLPAGSTASGVAGVEATALRLAHVLDAVPLRDGGDEQERFCPQDRLQVRWSAPTAGEFAVGGHVLPVGPAPELAATEVNGLVVCAGASYAYMGFEARWDGRSWQVAAVPSLSDEHDLHEEPAGEEHEDPERDAHEEEHADEPAAAAPQVERAVPAPHRPAPAQAAPRRTRGFSVPAVPGIDRYAAYDPQRVCDPTPKPGMAALRDLLLRTYPGTRSLGVSRTCTARGVSEHKEGRAFDWGVNAWVPSERAAAQSALSQLLATDSAGNRHALARRLGVMYVIWDKQIWSAYSADRGWRPYSGANPHTDHVHLSLSWAGAMGRTSYWQGDNAGLLAFDPELRLVDGVAAGVPTRTGGTTSTASKPEERASRRREDEPDEGRPERIGRREGDVARAGADLEQERPRDEAAAAERRAEREARKAAQQAQQQKADQKRAAAAARATARAQASAAKAAAKSTRKAAAAPKRQSAAPTRTRSSAPSPRSSAAKGGGKAAPKAAKGGGEPGKGGGKPGKGRG